MANGAEALLVLQLLLAVTNILPDMALLPKLTVIVLLVEPLVAVTPVGKVQV
jgi:hypothetical protein